MKNDPTRRAAMTLGAIPVCITVGYNLVTTTFAEFQSMCIRRDSQIADKVLQRIPM